MVVVFKDQLPEEVAQDESPADTRGNQLIFSEMEGRRPQSFNCQKRSQKSNRSVRAQSFCLSANPEKRFSGKNPKQKGGVPTNCETSKLGFGGAIIVLFGIVLLRFLPLNRFSPFWAGECTQNDSQTEWGNVSLELSRVETLIIVDLLASD